MKKNSKPDSSDDVYDVMQRYCQTKQYTFSESELQHMAEDMYLLFEGRGWDGVKFWPALAKRWVLNAKPKIKKRTISKPEGETIRSRILKGKQDGV